MVPIANHSAAEIAVAVAVSAAAVFVVVISAGVWRLVSMVLVRVFLGAISTRQNSECDSAFPQVGQNGTSWDGEVCPAFPSFCECLTSNSF